ncbi:pentapeptide repeat-containing protein [Candidatus Uabimicrobium sp. HlEnr_7]|uniref:pentapeptide repeat-containing protein n=1 Tax=Candidatus Uabimicrobium helgolandensis TaxID=3095367 RepID=UPI00355774E7
MSDLPTLSQEEAKEKLKNGERLHQVYVERLSMCKLEIETPVEITECKIGILDFNKNEFKQEFILRQCEVETLVLAETIFHAKCTLKKTKFGRAKIQRAQFKGNINAESAKFSYTSFYECIFEQNVNFGYASFYGDATFQGAELRKGGRFNSLRITNGSATFIGTFWGGKADFRQINVEKDFNISGSRIEDELLLIGSVIGLNTSLDNCILHAKTDLSNVMSGRNISIINATLGENQSFRFVDTTTPGLNIERSVVEGHVFPENTGNYQMAAKEYAFLRTAFQAMNRFDEEDWAYYQFKKMQRKSQPIPLSPIKGGKRLFEYLFLDLGCGYGTMPFRTLGAVGLLIFLFGACYSMLGAAGNISFGLENAKLNNFLNAINTSLVVFSGGYGDLQVTGIARLLAMVEYLIGVVFMGLFVVSFSRKIIR